MIKIIVILLIILAIVFIIVGLYCGLTVRNYSIESEKISSNIRIALITDLHSCYYGKNMNNLVDSIEKQNPDIVLLGGDIFDDIFSNSNTDIFLSSIYKKYQIYYVTGNHECRNSLKKFNKQMVILDKYNVIRLKGDVKELRIKDSIISLCGIDDPSISNINEIDNNYKEQLKRVTNDVNKNTFKILLAHRPELIEKYEQCDFDLALCGHTHGGQWRIPRVLNGLYAPNQGLFPKYAGGYYQIRDTIMIVSRGLSREKIPIPRFYNPPELVIVELKNKK